MFSWLKRSGARGQQPEAICTVTSALKELYRTKLLPLEEHYRFGDFHSPALEDADFDSKPMVLVAGQYSTGKTSFIQYLLEQEVPGSRVGPEPTTDCFVAVMHGETEGTVPGNALIVDPEKPFRKLNPFGNTFLNRCATRVRGIFLSLAPISVPSLPVLLSFSALIPSLYLNLSLPASALLPVLGEQVSPWSQPAWVPLLPSWVALGKWLDLFRASLILI